MLVTMATPRSSHMTDKNSIFTAHDGKKVKRKNPGISSVSM